MPIIDYKTLIVFPFVFFALFNSLFWACLIPKIIYDEIYKKKILNREILDIYNRNIIIASSIFLVTF